MVEHDNQRCHSAPSSHHPADEDPSGQSPLKNAHTQNIIECDNQRCNSELFISEYMEGSGNNKAVEIYNPTSSTVNLSGYTLYLVGNGGSFT